MKKLLPFLLLIALVSTFLVTPVTAQEEDLPKIGFLPGVVDPFYQVMEIGVNAAAADFGVEVITQYPEDWNVTLQTPILESYIARGDLDYLVIAPVHKEQMVAPLEAAMEAGIKIITVDTFLGDGDYVNGPVTFPLSYIGSNNVEGGKIAGEFLAERVGYEGKVYVQNTNPGVSTTEQRGEGFVAAIEQYPDMELVGDQVALLTRIHREKCPSLQLRQRELAQQ